MNEPQNNTTNRAERRNPCREYCQVHGNMRAEIDNLRDLVRQACDAIRFDQEHNPDRVMAWQVRFLELACAP